MLGAQAATAEHSQPSSDQHSRPFTDIIPDFMRKGTDYLVTRRTL